LSTIPAHRASRSLPVIVIPETIHSGIPSSKIAFVQDRFFRSRPLLVQDRFSVQDRSENKSAKCGVLFVREKHQLTDQLHHAFHHKLTIQTPQSAPTFLKIPL
jgi:hypothetical protein